MKLDIVRGKLGGGIRLSKCDVTLHSGRDKIGTVQNSGQFSVPGDLVIFPRQAIKITDCPGKFGTDGHLRQS